MLCKNCGTMNSADARFCSKCGADLTLQYNEETQQNYNQQNYNQQNYNPYAQQQAQFNAQPQQPMYNMPPMQQPPMPGKGLAIASMVCGIVTLALFCVWYLSIVTGILSIVFGGIAKSKGCRSGMATAGIACGAVGLGLMVLFIILGIAGLSCLSDPYYFY